MIIIPHKQSLADPLTSTSHTQCVQALSRPQIPMLYFQNTAVVIQMKRPVLVQIPLQTCHAWVQGLLTFAGSCGMFRLTTVFTGKGFQGSSMHNTGLAGRSHD